MSVPAVRRIVVGVDGSTDSVIALRWACREAGIRDAEVHAVHVREAPLHSVASYAVPTPVDVAHIPDFAPLISASTTVGQNMKKGAIVIYETTVYPGASADLIRSIPPASTRKASASPNRCARFNLCVVPSRSKLPAALPLSAPTFLWTLTSP